MSLLAMLVRHLVAASMNFVNAGGQGYRQNTRIPTLRRPRKTAASYHATTTISPRQDEFCIYVQFSIPSSILPDWLVLEPPA